MPRDRDAKNEDAPKESRRCRSDACFSFFEKKRKVAKKERKSSIVQQNVVFEDELLQETIFIFVFSFFLLKSPFAVLRCWKQKRKHQGFLPQMIAEAKSAFESGCVLTVRTLASRLAYVIRKTK